MRAITHPYTLYGETQNKNQELAFQAIGFITANTLIQCSDKINCSTALIKVKLLLSG